MINVSHEKLYIVKSEIFIQLLVAIIEEMSYHLLNEVLCVAYQALMLLPCFCPTVTLFSIRGLGLDVSHIFYRISKQVLYHGIKCGHMHKVCVRWFFHSFIYLHSFNPYKVRQPTGYGTSHISKAIKNKFYKTGELKK